MFDKKVENELFSFGSLASIPFLAANKELSSKLNAPPLDGTNYESLDVLFSNP